MPDASERRVHRLPLPSFQSELSPAAGGEPVVLATTTARGDFPPRRHVAESLESMQNGVKHPVGPLDAPSRQFPDTLEDGVTFAPSAGDGSQRNSDYSIARGGGKSMNVRTPVLLPLQPSRWTGGAQTDDKRGAEALRLRVCHKSDPSSVSPAHELAAPVSKVRGCGVRPGARRAHHFALAAMDRVM